VFVQIGADTLLVKEGGLVLLNHDEGFVLMSVVAKASPIYGKLLPLLVSEVTASNVRVEAPTSA
jgi:hypothetical protein